MAGKYQQPKDTQLETITSDEGFAYIYTPTFFGTNKRNIIKKASYSTLRWILLSCLLLILVWFGALRFWKLHLHYPTIDDSGVILNYLNASQQFDESELRSRINNRSHPEFGSIYYRSLRLADSWHVLLPFQAGLTYLAKAKANTAYGRYAPAQHAVGAWLVNDGYTYNQLKFWARLPSVIASILALALLPVVTRRFSNNKFSVAPLMAMLLMACSWQQFFIARQSYPYALASLALVVMLLRLSALSNNESKVSNNWVLEVLFILILLLCHHQVLAFIPPYLICLTFFANRGAPLSWRFKYSALIGCVLVIAILPFTGVLNINLNTAFNWDSGRWQEYHFTWHANLNFYQQVKYLVWFCLSNSVAVVASCLGFVPYHDYILWFGLLALMLSVLGLWYYWQSTQVAQNALAVFILLAFIIWVIMIGLGWANLSPSRQTSILTPILSILCAHGLTQLVRRLCIRIGFKNRQDTFTLVAVMLIGIGMVSAYMLYYRYMRYEWSDPFIEARNAISILDQKDPSPIVLETAWTAEGQLLWLPEKSKTIINFDRKGQFPARPPGANLKDLTSIYILTRTAPSPEWRWAIGKYLKDSLGATNPVVSAEFRINRREQPNYFPLSSLNPIGVYVAQVSLHGKP